MSDVSTHTTTPENPYTKALADISMSKLHNYRKFIVPVQNMAIKTVGDMSSKPMMDKAGGMASDQVVQQLTPSLKAGIMMPTTRGVAPNSGSFVNNMGAMRGTMADATANADLGGKVGMRDKQLQGYQNILGWANNQGNRAQASMTDVADAATQKSITDAQNSMMNASGMGLAAGTLAGMGAAGLGGR